MSYASCSVDRLISKLGINKVEDLYKLKLIAFEIGIDIVEGTLTSCESLLMYKNGKPYVIVNKGSHPQRKRFSIAHEIGHFILHNDGVATVCSSDFIESWETCSIPENELEANEFAANLILPERFFKKDSDFDPDFSELLRLCDKYQTSVIATSRRYIDYFSAPAAVVMSTSGVIKWFVPNKLFQEEKLFVDVRAKVAGGTQANSLFLGLNTSNKPKLVDQELWLKNQEKLNGDFLELSFIMRNFDSVISILWLDEY